ncbi:MAG: hypothetical protein V2J42_00700 [Wenzhouxiangella sp.]|jgi:hypothetical protein|nr:hypothetical protein [Wenzhouxiangella sp.]
MVNWLFHPFAQLTGRRALLPGLVIMLAVAVLARAAGLETDAVLSLHFMDGLALGTIIGQGLINWLLMVACLVVAARLLEVKVLDIPALMGTQAFARWPLLVAVLYLSLPPIAQRMRELTDSLMQVMPTQPGQVISDAAHMADAFILTAYGLPVLACLIWMAWLMLQGFAAATHLSGPRAVFPFAACLLVAHLTSLGLNSLIS